MVVTGDGNFELDVDDYTGDQVYITKQDGEGNDITVEGEAEAE